MKAFINFGKTTIDSQDRKTHTNAIQGVGEWIDISSLILDSGFTRTQRIGESGRFTRSILKFTMKPTLGKRYIANEILTSDGDIRAKFLTDDDKPYFIGTIRPLASITATSYLDNLSLEVIDDSYFLEWVNTRETVITGAEYVYNPNKKNKSLIHMLLSYTGGNLTNLKITANSDVGTPVLMSNEKIEKGKGVKTLIDDVFYEYNLQYKFLPDGTMHIILSAFNGENTKPLKTLQDSDFKKKLTVSRSEDGRGGVVVKWHQSYTGYRTIAKYDLSKFLGLQEMQDTYIANGEAVYRHPTFPNDISNGKGYVDFPDEEYRYLDINNVDVDESNKKLVRIDEKNIVCECSKGYINVTGPAGLAEKYRLELSPIIDKTKLAEGKIGAYLHITPFKYDGDLFWASRRKYTHLKSIALKAKCTYYDESGDYYEYILGDDNVGANEYTEYKCKYLIGTAKAPDDIIALANRLFVERANGGTTYSTEMARSEAESLTVGGVYSLESDILGLKTLVRLTSVQDKGDSVNGVLTTVKFQGWQDVNSIGTGKTTYTEKATKAELKKEFKLEANTTIVNSDSEDDTIAIIAKGDVVDLYKSSIKWLFDEETMPSIYKTSDYSVSIPMSAFEKATTYISAECSECDGTNFSSPLVASIAITKPQGAKGEKGDKGDKGDTGEKGEDGTSLDITASPTSYNISSRGTTTSEQRITLNIYSKNLNGELTIALREPKGGITLTHENDVWTFIIPKGEKLKTFIYDVLLDGTVLRSNTVNAVIQQSRASYLGIYKKSPSITQNGEPLMDGDYFLSDITSTKEDDGLIPNTPYIYKNGAFSVLSTSDKNYSAIMGTILGDALENGGISDDNPMYTFISKLATKDAFIQSLFSQDINISGVLKSNNFVWETNNKKGFKLDSKSGMAYLQDAVFGGEIDSIPLTSSFVKAQTFNFNPTYCSLLKFKQQIGRIINNGSPIFSALLGSGINSLKINGVEYVDIISDFGFVCDNDEIKDTNTPKITYNYVRFTDDRIEAKTKMYFSGTSKAYYDIQGILIGVATIAWSKDKQNWESAIHDGYGAWYFECECSYLDYVWIKYTPYNYNNNNIEASQVKGSNKLLTATSKVLYLKDSDGNKVLLNPDNFPNYANSEYVGKNNIDITAAYSLKPKITYKWEPFSADYDSTIKYVYIADFCNSTALEVNKVFQTDTTKSKITVSGSSYTIKAIQITSSSLVLTMDVGSTLTYAKSSYQEISGSIAILPQNAKVEATDIFPKQNAYYDCGSSTRKWNRIYGQTANTDTINNSSTIYSPYIYPQSNNSGNIGSTSKYFNSGAMNTLFANYLRTINGGYHLGNLVESTETSTSAYYTGSRGTSWTAAGFSVYWNGIIINSQPQKFAILTGSCSGTVGKRITDDKMYKIMLPQQYKFKQTNYNYGNSYLVFASGTVIANAAGGRTNFGELPLIYESDSSYSRFNKTTEYFCVNADVINSNNVGALQFLVLGFIQ